MPSSISSSKGRVPLDRRGLSVLVAIAFFVAGLAGTEIFWRQRGYSIATVDSHVLWCYHRACVSNRDHETVALLGASRIQLDFSTETFRKRFPQWNLAQLAITGEHPVATLRDLADDEDFVGTVICSVTANSFDPWNWDGQRDYVAYYHTKYGSFDNAVNSAIGRYIQSRLVTRNPSLRLKRLFVCLLKKEGLAPKTYIVTHPDRSQSADYTLVDIADMRQRCIAQRRQFAQSAPSTSPEEWLSRLDVVEQAVRRIQLRGGVVAFVRFPTTGEHWHIDEETRSKKTFWNRFAQCTDAVTLHFRDVPELAEFECPDSSHLDYHDKQRFTRVLLDELVRRGVFQVGEEEPESNDCVNSATRSATRQP